MGYLAGRVASFTGPYHVRLGSLATVINGKDPTNLIARSRFMNVCTAVRWDEFFRPHKACFHQEKINQPAKT